MHVLVLVSETVFQWVGCIVSNAKRSDLNSRCPSLA